MDITEQVADLDAKASAAFGRWYLAPEGSAEANTAWDEYEQCSGQARQLVNEPDKTHN